MYGVLKRKELSRPDHRLGLPPDGVPVRCSDRGPTLPAGPAALAAKTGASIVHIAIRRAEDPQSFLITYSDPITVESIG